MKTSPSSPSPASGKTLSTILTVVQLLCVAGVIVWAVLLKRDLASAEKDLAALRARPTTTDNSAREAAALRARVATLESQLATAATMAMEAKAAPTPAAAPAAPAAPANPLAALAALTNTPAMRNMMATTQKKMLERRFADLFTQFQFSPEQRTRFVDTMFESQADQTDIGLKVLSGNLSAEEKESLRKQVQNMEATSDQKIRELLGDETKYAAYKQYNEQANERTQVTALRASLAESGQAPLNPEQTAALTNIMYTERKSFTPSAARVSDTADQLTAPSAEAVEAMLRDQEVLNNRIADRAASVLSPAQLADLRRTQAARQEAIKSSAEMSRQFLGVAPAPK